MRDETFEKYIQDELGKELLRGEYNDDGLKEAKSLVIDTYDLARNCDFTFINKEGHRKEFLITMLMYAIYNSSLVSNPLIKIYDRDGLVNELTLYTVIRGNLHDNLRVEHRAIYKGDDVENLELKKYKIINFKYLTFDEYKESQTLSQTLRQFINFKYLIFGEYKESQTLSQTLRQFIIPYTIYEQFVA